MNTSEFTTSPFFRIEELLSQFLDERLQKVDLFSALETEHDRVSVWNTKLSKFHTGDDHILKRLRRLGTEGTRAILDGLEELFGAVEEDCQDSMEEAAEVMWTGHQLIQSSFEVCEDIEETASEAIFESIDFI